MEKDSTGRILCFQHQEAVYPILSNSLQSTSGWTKRIIVGIVLVLIISLFAGCTTPFRPPMPKTTAHQAPQAHKNVNAAYNKPYTVRGQKYHPMRSAEGYVETGIASWYGSESGDRTAMGTRFNPHDLTAAHKTLPLPTKVRVTNLRNGRSVNVVVNDRGPFKRNRIIDLSHGAAKKIGLDKQGIAKVKVEYLEALASN
ncbi:MAG: septal ring lytic transglycosylase RlpA family protein [Nitrosomonas sp.]|nr:septal ring lytic transglycosylase RlpA family protein [Nitrosomonas sp.]